MNEDMVDEESPRKVTVLDILSNGEMVEATKEAKSNVKRVSWFRVEAVASSTLKIRKTIINSYLY